MDRSAGSLYWRLLRGNGTSPSGVGTSVAKAIAAEARANFCFKVSLHYKEPNPVSAYSFRCADIEECGQEAVAFYESVGFIKKRTSILMILKGDALSKLGSAVAQSP